VAELRACEWADQLTREACTEPGIVRTIDLDLGSEVGLCQRHYAKRVIAGKVGPIVRVLPETR
jgi:hypothetical protein